MFLIYENVEYTYIEIKVIILQLMHSGFED